MFFTYNSSAAVLLAPDAHLAPIEGLIRTGIETAEAYWHLLILDQSWALSNSSHLDFSHTFSFLFFPLWQGIRLRQHSRLNIIFRFILFFWIIFVVNRPTSFLIPLSLSVALWCSESGTFWLIKLVIFLLHSHFTWWPDRIDNIFCRNSSISETGLCCRSLTLLRTNFIDPLVRSYFLSLAIFVQRLCQIGKLFGRDRAALCLLAVSG